MACVKFHLTSINFSFTKSVRKDPTSEGTVNQKESYELGSEERLNTNLKIILTESALIVKMNTDEYGCKVHVSVLLNIFAI